MRPHPEPRSAAQIRALPRDPYGRGKLAIEQALLAAAGQTGIELVILRPPLVYGPGVKGNFRSLLRLVESGIRRLLPGSRTSAA